MKKHIPIGTVCWIAGAIVWAIIAWINFSEGKVGFSLIQVVISVLFLVHASTSYFKYKKKQ